MAIKKSDTTNEKRYYTLNEVIIMTVKPDPDEGINANDLPKLAKSIGLESEQDVKSYNVRLNC